MTHADWSACSTGRGREHFSARMRVNRGIILRRLTVASRSASVSRVLLLTVLAAGCVTATTRSYMPSPRNPSYTPKDAEQALRQYVQLQCGPRAAAQRPDTGSALFIVQIDSLGHASRADLRRSSNDEELDGLFGTVTAQLNFSADSSGSRTNMARKAPVSIDFRCSGDSASVKLDVGARS
jgi:hypothetical protein